MIKLLLMIRYIHVGTRYYYNSHSIYILYNPYNIDYNMIDIKY